MDKSERLIERIHKYLKYKSISPYEFEKTIEVGNGYLNKQEKGKGTVGSENLEKIHRQYPGLNILWLLTGEGEMEISNLHTQNAHPTAHPTTGAVSSNNDFSIIGDWVRMTETLVESLKKQIQVLQSSNTDKDKIITLLEEKLKEDKTRGN